jgi:hypothetical protein
VVGSVGLCTVVDYVLGNFGVFTRRPRMQNLEETTSTLCLLVDTRQQLFNLFIVCLQLSDVLLSFLRLPFLRALLVSDTVSKPNVTLAGIFRFLWTTLRPNKRLISLRGNAYFNRWSRGIEPTSQWYRLYLSNSNQRILECNSKRITLLTLFVFTSTRSLLPLFKL